MWGAGSLGLLLLYRPGDNKHVSKIQFAVLKHRWRLTNLVFGGGGLRGGHGLRFLLGGIYVCVLQVRQMVMLIWLIMRNSEADV